MREMFFSRNYTNKKDFEELKVTKSRISFFSSYDLESIWFLAQFVFDFNLTPCPGDIGVSIQDKYFSKMIFLHLPSICHFRISSTNCRQMRVR